VRSTAVIATLMATLLAGCTSGTTKAAELLETAHFEEKQNNLEHASQLYREIVTTYPGSPSARDAAARLVELKLKRP
jgi:outer membrane protein assembly factor BamD (BamD/ComL family)